MQRPENWEHKTDINSDFEENNKFPFVLTHTSCILLLLCIIIKSSTQRFYLIFIFTEKYIVGILCITDQLFQDTYFHLHVFDQNQSFQKFEHLNVSSESYQSPRQVARHLLNSWRAQAEHTACLLAM